MMTCAVASVTPYWGDHSRGQTTSMGHDTPAHGRLRARRLSRRNQSGFGLVEVLVSVALISLLVGGISAGIVTMGRSSESASRGTRANILLTGFGEALRQLSYRDCSTGDLKANYTEAFELYDAELPSAERLIQPGATDTSVSIQSVDTVGGCTGGAPDLGQQILSIRAEVGGIVRTENLVKRDPDYVPTGPLAVPKATLVSATGDSQGIVTLDGSGSTPAAEIISYEWDCGTGGNSLPITTDPVDPASVCIYAASSSGPQTKTIKLTVTDQYGITNTGSVNVTIPKAANARLAPVAKIAASPTSGNTDLVVTFNPAGSNSLDGSIVEYRWNFGDPTSGSSNTLTTPTPTTPGHTYERGGAFTATLIVVDDVGLTSAPATVTINVTQTGPPKPIPSFTMSPQPAVAPQTVSFNGTASKTAGGSAVSSYYWDFGDGTTAPGATPSHLYAYPGNYNVTLTVEDSAGVSASITKTLVVKTFSNPPDFRMTDARGELAHSGDFYFAWTNLGASAGDPVSYEIQIRVIAGCVAFEEKSRTVTAGAVGTVQTYDFKVDWPASNVCLGSLYEWRFRTKRTSPTNGTSYTPWSAYKQWLITHT